MTRMFPFISKCWNPLGGKCQHNCNYCWAQKLAKKFYMTKYTGPAHLSRKELARVFTEKDFVFCCDMCDLFGSWVPADMIQRILDRINISRATYLLLTKNPARYAEFEIPPNCVCGATIESDLEMDLSAAPPRHERLRAMTLLDHKRKMLSVEPVMRFTEFFARKIAAVNPEFAAVGFDNYGCHLEEPTLAETMQLIAELEAAGIKVYRKTLRERCQP